MTKYVVNSGHVSGDVQKAKKFFAEIIKGVHSHPKILLCYFAIPREVWEEEYAEDLKVLPDFFEPGITPTFEMALPESFERQIKASDAIYIHGGDDHLVQYWLKQFDLPRIWNGKVVATSSASSDALSTHFWTGDWRTCMEGLGILPIKFLAHFNSQYGSQSPRGSIDWGNAYTELEAYGDTSLPIYALEEGDFTVFEL